MFEQLKKDSGPNEASSGLNGHRIRTISVAMALILVVLISAGSGVYAGASFFAQQAPGVTVTTTIYTTTTSWTTSTIWSTVTEVVQGILTNIEYTTSTSTVTVTGSPTYPTGKIVTANGNAQIDTGQSMFGGASGLFDGTGDYLSTPDSADWAFGTGDFTIDFWVRFNVLPASNTWSCVFTQYAGDPPYHTWGVVNDRGTYYWTLQVKNPTAINIVKQATTLTTNTWYHVAFVRSGNSWYVFQNGVQVGSTVTNSYTMGDLAGSVYVASFDRSSSFLNGWLDEFRVSKGMARWTSNFTPPSAPYGRDSSTVLLLHMDGSDASTTFIDGY